MKWILQKQRTTVWLNEKGKRWWVDGDGGDGSLMTRSHVPFSTLGPSQLFNSLLVTSLRAAKWADRQSEWIFGIIQQHSTRWECGLDKESNWHTGCTYNNVCQCGWMEWKRATTWRIWKCSFLNGTSPTPLFHRNRTAVVGGGGSWRKGIAVNAIQRWGLISLFPINICIIYVLNSHSMPSFVRYRENYVPVIGV